MIIVLTGIDGSGKSTAARALVSAVQADGGAALLLNNHAGRRSMSVLAAKLGLRLPYRVADAVETTFRVWNVLVNHFRASRFEGLVVMDRHLHCQLALRAAKGLRRGHLLAWLLGALPAPDAVVHLEVDPVVAHQRIVARGADAETLEDLASFAQAYRQLPGYSSFTKVDASVPTPELAQRLAGLVHALRQVPADERHSVLNCLHRHAANKRKADGPKGPSASLARSEIPSATQSATAKTFRLLPSRSPWRSARLNRLVKTCWWNATCWWTSGWKSRCRPRPSSAPR